MMRKVATVSILVLILTAFVTPSYAGVTNGGKPFLPGDELILGGITNGGKPLVGGDLFSANGFGMDSYAGGPGDWDLGFSSGYGYEPFDFSWSRMSFGFGFRGIGFGFGLMDFFSVLFYLDFFLT